MGAVPRPCVVVAVQQTDTMKGQAGIRGEEGWWVLRRHPGLALASRQAAGLPASNRRLNATVPTSLPDIATSQRLAITCSRYCCSFICHS